MCRSRPRAATLLLLLLLWACLWAETAGVGGQQEQWGSCHDLVCREVQSQVEGLTRLKRMRNYILQTMHVMKTLLTSLDAEVFDTRQDITRFIGHRCPAVHALLEDFNEEFEDDDLQTSGHTNSQGLTLTITQESKQQTDEDEDQSWPQIQHSTGSPYNNVHGSGVGSGSILEVTSPQNNGSQSSVYRTSNTSESGGYYTSSSSLDSTISSLDSSRNTGNILGTEGGQKLTNKFDATFTSQQETTNHPKMVNGGQGSRWTVPGYNNNNSGGTGSGYGGADSVSSGTNSTWGTSRTVWSNGGPGGSNGADETGGGHGGPGSGRGGPGSGRGGPGGGRGGSGSGRGGPGGGRGGPGGGRGGPGGGRGGPGGGRGGPGGRDGSNCSGVSRDSPHWVLGLDVWCQQNCAVGNCPAEYCVC